METRSFLAFELPAEIREILIHTAGEMKIIPLDVRWVRVSNIHLTVIFMGNIPSEQLESIGEIAATVCQDFSPFNICLKGAGVFPGRRNPRVLWLGLGGDIQSMSDFRDELQERLKPFGIRKENILNPTKLFL